MATEAPAGGFLVVGLGNPGERYRATRHNAGYLVVECLAAHWGVPWREEPGGRLSEAEREGRRVLLAEPATYMNRSGEAVRSLLSSRGLDRSNLVVIHDDLDLPFGQVRIRRGGGDGGHRGVRSIIEALATADFTRVKVGIGRPGDDSTVVDYVLSPFAPTEVACLQKVVERAARAAACVVLEGPERAMNRFHT